jgi:hypothetical protein
MNNFKLIALVANLCILQCNAAASSSDQQSLNQALYTAIEQEDISSATQSLDAGADPNATNGYFREPFLHCAISSNNSDMVALLLARGANPNAKNYHNWTPLCLIANPLLRTRTHTRKAPIITAMLLKAGAHIDPDNKNLYCIARNTSNQNKDLFPIIAQLMTAGEYNTRKEPCEITPSETTHSHARKEFIKAYPGNTLQEKIVLSIVLRMCSDDEAIHSEAKEQARALLTHPNHAHKISRFLPLSEKSHPPFEIPSLSSDPGFLFLRPVGIPPRPYDKSLCPPEFLLDEPSFFDPMYPTR